MAPIPHTPTHMLVRCLKHRTTQEVEGCNAGPSLRPGCFHPHVAAGQLRRMPVPRVHRSPWLVFSWQALRRLVRVVRVVCVWYVWCVCVCVCACVCVCFSLSHRRRHRDRQRHRHNNDMEDFFFLFFFFFVFLLSSWLSGTSSSRSSELMMPDTNNNPLK